MGADINAVNENGDTVLHLLAEDNLKSNDLENVIDYFLNCNANVEIKNC